MSIPLRAGILLADDHVMVRRGLRLVLDAEPDLRVVAEAGDGEEAIRMAMDERVDLAIVDLSMPVRTGLEAAGEIARRRPAVRVLMLSMHDNEEYLFQARAAGAAGYVLKSAVDTDLVGAVRAALRGAAFVIPSEVSASVRERLERGEDAPAYSPLSPRETEVVRLIAEGRSTREIAAALDISPKTVDRHRENVLHKLELRDRVDLTRYALRRGLVEP